MTDRADEIAAKVYDTLDAGHMISEGDLADLIRAYGDERANAALKSMNKVLDDERSARLERNPRLRREIRNAALDEAVEAVDRYMIKTNASVSWSRLVQDILALKEKP